MDSFFPGTSIMLKISAGLLRGKEIAVPENDRSKDLSSEEEGFSSKRRSIRSATEGGTLKMNCSSMRCISQPATRELYKLPYLGGTKTGKKKRQ